MVISRTHITALAVLFGLSLGCLGDLPAEEPNPAAAAVRKQRLELLEERIQQFELLIGEDADRKLRRGEQPILRWSNPVRDNVNDGVIFLFLEGERPRAVVTVWADGQAGNLASGKLFREFVSLSGEPLVCRRNGEAIWTPKTGGLVDQEFKDAPAPADRPTQRLIQMRTIARRFAASNFKMDSPSELRLLTQPLYRYPGMEAEILDGALFAFVEGNDPEALLLLDAPLGPAGKGYIWRYTLARITSYRVRVTLDGREIFTAEPYWTNPRSATNPYAERMDGTFKLDE